MSPEELLAELEAVLDKPSPRVTSAIELGAVTSFAEAVGDPIVDDDGGILVPPTFLGSLPYRRQPMPGGAEDNMVILDNTATLARLPVIGEKVTTSAAFTQATQRGPLIMLKLACRYTDESDAELGVMTCSWLIDVEGEPRAPAAITPRPRTELLTGGAAIGQSSIHGHGGPDPRPTRAWDAVDLERLSPGYALPPLAKAPLSTLQFVKYAGASRDFNPIHYDSHFAARSGFPDVIAPGLMKMAFFAEHMTLWGNRWAELRRLESRYKGIDLPGARLTSHGTVRKVEADGDGRRIVTIELALRDESGEANTVGSAVVASMARST